MQSERDLLTAAYDGFNRRDIDAVVALMYADVDWPNGMEGGRVHGRDGVREYWTRQWALIDPRVDPVAMTEIADGKISVEVHQVVRDLSGAVLADQMVQHMYLIENNLIARMDIHDPA